MPKPPEKSDQEIVPVESIQQRIYLIRGHKVMLDRDLAELYGVTTRRLNEQLRRNLDRFPSDFAFLLTQQEFANLKSHFATSSSGWGGRRKLPYAFTEHGVVMAANVLTSSVAVRASIQVVRAFVRLREILSTHKDLARKLEKLEGKYDANFRVVFDAIRKLMGPEKPPPRRRIGFEAEAEKE